MDEYKLAAALRVLAKRSKLAEEAAAISALADVIDHAHGPIDPRARCSLNRIDRLHARAMDLLTEASPDPDQD